MGLALEAWVLTVLKIGNRWAQGSIVVTRSIKVAVLGRRIIDTTRDTVLVKRHSWVPKNVIAGEGCS